MAPLYGDVLDHNIVFEYQYDLIVGSLGDIRGWVYAHQPDPRPDYSFVADRQHWLCPGGDAGFPLGGRLRVNLTGFDPMIFGPAWRVADEDVPQLYVTAAYHVPNPVPGALTGQLFWATNLDGDIALGEYSESEHRVRRGRRRPIPHLRPRSLLVSGV